jgi:hypothetical protein
MAWRDTLLQSFGPGLLGGITFGRWVELLIENRFSVSPSYWPRALTISLQSIATSMVHWAEEIRFGKETGSAIHRYLYIVLFFLQAEFGIKKELLIGSSNFIEQPHSGF